MRRSLAFLTVLLSVALIYLLGGFEFLERARIDARYRLDSRSASQDVVLVEIDPHSLGMLPVWPWPRGYHATVVENLSKAGAATVAFDIEFSSRSDPDEDAQLSLALASSASNVVLPAFRQWQQREDGSKQLMFVKPLPELARHGRLASINVRPDGDGLVRSYETQATIDGESIPALGTLLAGGQASTVEEFYIDFGIDPDSIPRVSFVDVLTGQFDPELIRGKSVIVGATAIELGDQITVPRHAALPGPLVQALAFESMRQERMLRRSGAMLTLGLSLLLATTLVPPLRRYGWRGGLLLTGLWLFGPLLVGAGVELLFPILIDVTPAAATVVGIYIFSLAGRIDSQAIGLLRQRRKMRRTESLMKHVVQNSFDAILTFDQTGKIDTFNGAAERMFHCREEQARGRNVSRMIGSQESGSLLARAAEGPTEAMALVGPEPRPDLEVVVTAIETDESPKLVAVVRDITQRKRHQEQLRHNATHDPLTGLPNRILLIERLRELIAEASNQGRPAAVLLLDLDRFKEINEALGHAVGDALLREVALRLAGPLAEEEMLSRLGGDEFAVLLPHADDARAKRVGWSLIESLRQPFELDGFSLQVETSVGVTLYPQHGAEAETLLQRADVAMCVAKGKRAGLVTYGPEQDFNQMRQLTIKGDLRQAIDGGELRLVYQPKVHHASQRVVGVEALVRWEHPDLGFIPPDEFIGVAEHCGLIEPLTQWVLETALAQASEWRAQDCPLRVSVNLSARNLAERDLPQRIRELMTRYEMAPHHLNLEITESAIMDDPEGAIENMARLRELGVGISVDDFGTGYSSLAYLLKLPANELKIDKSFITDLDHDKGSMTIVRSTIDLAHALGMTVVAEGVETPDAWRRLVACGCDVGQGYYFSRPIAPESIPSFSREVVVQLPTSREFSVTAGDDMPLGENSLGEAH